MRQILPGIAKIWVLDWQGLPDNMGMMAKCGMGVSISTALEEVPMVGKAKCTNSTTFVGKMEREEVNLTFSTTIPIEKCQKKAFIIKTANGECFAIGDKAWNMPEVKMVKDTGNTSGESSKHDYTVKWIGEKGLVKVNIAGQ